MNIINDLLYPCYIGEIPKDSSKVKQEIDYYTVWGYTVGSSLFLYDAIPTSSYNNKKYKYDYSERIDTVRAISSLNRFLNIIDLPMDKVFNPKELNDFIQGSLFNENKGIIVYSSYSEYDFKKDKPDMYEIIRDGI